MNKFCFFILLEAFLLSCDDKNELPVDEKENKNNYLTYILAGQTDGVGIRYTNIIPDEELKIAEYPAVLESFKKLDLNGDNIYDFELKYSVSNPQMLGAGGSGLRIIPLGMNSVCVSNFTNQWITSLNYNDTINHWVDSLSFNDTISINNNWLDTTAILFSYNWMYNGTTYTFGYWYEHPDVYVGVRILKGEDSLYGWIDLYRNTIIGYAVTVPY